MTPVARGLRFVWDRPVLFNLALAVLIIAVGRILLATAYADTFTCRYLLEEELGLGGTCDFEPTLGIASWFGEVDPTLARAIDPPLNGIRRAVIWLLFVGIVVVSAYLTFIVNNARKVVRLITFDRRQWGDLMAYLRLFLVITVLVTLAVYRYVL